MKKDSRVNLKVDPELHRRIKVAAAMAETEMYTQVERAWAAYDKAGGENVASLLSCPGQGKSDGTISTNYPKDKIDSILTDQFQSPLSDLEFSHVTRLIRLLRSPTPGVPDAIISNLATFDGYVDLYERSSGSHPAQRAGEPSGIGGDSARIDSIRKSEESVGRAIESLKRADERIKRELEAIAPSGKDKRAEKESGTGKTRKRSGA